MRANCHAPPHPTDRAVGRCSPSQSSRGSTPSWVSSAFIISGSAGWPRSSSVLDEYCLEPHEAVARLPGPVIEVTLMDSQRVRGDGRQFGWRQSEECRDLVRECNGRGVVEQEGLSELRLL